MTKFEDKTADECGCSAQANFNQGPGCYIAFATLVMLNLVTGVFVEGAQRIIKEDRDNDLVRTVCKLFMRADDNNDHDITWLEFEEHIEDPGMETYFQAVDLNREQGRDLFRLLDADGSGTLSVEEFVRGCVRLKGPARSVDLASLVQDFEAHASNNHRLFAAIEDHITESHNILVSAISNLSLKVSQGGRPTSKPGWVDAGEPL